MMDMMDRKPMIKIISKDSFTFMKGIAIICMVIHHAFGFPSFYIEEINYPNIRQYADYICNTTNLCVPTFVFITGGGYCLHCDKSLKYSVKKVLEFYINYWIVLLILMTVAAVCGSYLPIKSIVLEAVGVEHILMKFCWYVPFYAIVMFILPLYSKFLTDEKKWYVDIVITIAFSLFLRLLSNALENYDDTGLSSNLSWYFPVLAAGYLLIKYDILDKVNNWVQRKCHMTIQIITGITLVMTAFFLYGSKKFVRGCNTGLIWVPVLILGMAFLHFEKVKRLRKMIEVLGLNSMNIWFLHQMFFSIYTREILQPLAYWPKVPIFVIAWILFLCTGASMLIMPIQKKAIEFVNRYACFIFKD